MTDTPTTANPAKLDFKKIFPIFVVVLIDLLGLTIIIPLLPIYAASFGADPSMIGLLQAAYPTMQFVGAPQQGGNRPANPPAQRPGQSAAPAAPAAKSPRFEAGSLLGLVFVALIREVLRDLELRVPPTDPLLPHPGEDVLGDRVDDVLCARDVVEERAAADDAVDRDLGLVGTLGADVPPLVHG